MISRGSRVARQVRPTALVYCEGGHELWFTRHLRKTYSKTSISSTHFTILQGGGGSQDKLVIEALKIPGDFTRVLVKLDDDRPSQEIDKANRITSKATTSQKQVLIHRSKPCLDALLLSILNPGVSYVRRQSKTCKKEFEVIIPNAKRTSSAPYERIFTYSVLEAARKRIPELDDLISFFET